MLQVSSFSGAGPMEVSRRTPAAGSRKPSKSRDNWRRHVPSVVRAVNISGDGRLIVAAYGNGTIRRHRLDEGRELLTLHVLADRQNCVAWSPGLRCSSCCDPSQRALRRFWPSASNARRNHSAPSTIRRRPGQWPGFVIVAVQLDRKARTQVKSRYLGGKAVQLRRECLLIGQRIASQLARAQIKAKGRLSLLREAKIDKLSRLRTPPAGVALVGG
jgi:hypothetical protein